MPLGVLHVHGGDLREGTSYALRLVEPPPVEDGVHLVPLEQVLHLAEDGLDGRELRRPRRVEDVADLVLTEERLHVVRLMS